MSHGKSLDLIAAQARADELRRFAAQPSHRHLSHPAPILGRCLRMREHSTMCSPPSIVVLPTRGIKDFQIRVDIASCQHVGRAQLCFSGLYRAHLRRSRAASHQQGWRCFFSMVAPLVTPRSKRIEFILAAAIAWHSLA